ncbi:hypothetical protein FNW52_01105 [Flavobacterium sp. ZT3R18]|uniref:hypothetical protein n=1 Tax=Flavobacterium sp. ZT3R18 TaxID=2594429 RepID=UPI00117AD456|nr:hypothetical protein [Flavobacterium sp. ZT3R18]TRX38675.1 hypothetical protein FNW52_01105 [Flavobacterium sp. ZT3R18]
MNKTGIIFLVLLMSFLSFAQKKLSFSVVETIPEMESFYQLNREEKNLDTLSKKKQKEYQERFLEDKNDVKSEYFKELEDFGNNRTRLILLKFKNEKQELHQDEDGFIPLYCNCDLQKDTLIISSGWNYYGKFGFIIKVNKNSFQAVNYSDEDTIQLKKKDLVLNKQPNFRPNQQLSGILNYETEREIVDKEEYYYSGKMYFTCIVKTYHSFEEYLKKH